MTGTTYISDKPQISKHGRHSNDVGEAQPGCPRRPSEVFVAVHLHVWAGSAMSLSRKSLTVERAREWVVLAYLISAGSMARAGDMLAFASQWRDGVGGLAVVVACHLESGVLWPGRCIGVGNWMKYCFVAAMGFRCRRSWLLGDGVTSLPLRARSADLYSSRPQYCISISKAVHSLSVNYH